MTKAMRQVTGSLKVDLAQYRDLEAFASFASDLDDASKAQLGRGERIIELFKQPQYSPYPVEEQVVSIWAGTNGYLDDIPVSDVNRFEKQFIEYLRASENGVLSSIRETNRVSDETFDALRGAIAEFKARFEVSGDGGATPAAEPPAEAMAEGEEGHEQITRHVPPPSKDK